VSFSIIIIYSILFGLIVKSFREQYECQEDFNCIRFCSTDVEKYSDKFLANDFLNSESSKELFIQPPFDKIDIDDIKIYRGSPVCGGLSYLPSKISLYGFHFVSKILFEKLTKSRVWDGLQIKYRGKITWWKRCQ